MKKKMMRPEKIGLKGVVCHKYLGFLSCWKSFKPKKGINRISFSTDPSKGSIKMDYTGEP